MADEKYADDLWERKFNEMKNEKERLEKDHHELQQKYKQLQNKANEESNTRRVLADDYWQLIIDQLKSNNRENIKAMIKKKELSLEHDVDDRGYNVLHFAASYGCYEIVQFCINLGANVDAKDDKGQTALDKARKYGYYHIEQLLLFSKMKVDIGNELRQTAYDMHKQDGLNANLLTELTEIGEQNKELFEKTLMELMIRVITNKLSFSDDILNLCWNIATRNNKDALQSELWKTIKATCSQIIETGGKRDWYWLKECIIPSTLWYREIGAPSSSTHGNPQYLYYELLKLVGDESENQLKKLKDDLDVLASQHPDEWTALVKWDIPNEYEQVRQDVIPHGVVSAYTYNQLFEGSDASFNSARFYDHNQYLSQLVLLAHIVDDEFHASVQRIFKINKTTNIAAIDFNKYRNDDEKKGDDINDGDGVIEYSRGPVKLIERARYKAENDYSGEPYPASACVLDLNRCSLVFNDISTMLTALELFVNKIKYFQSGNIIGIVRDKNGFIEYAKKVQYADIKLNVLIKGVQNNIIGEVQFLLRRMKQFKNKAHNLYAIQRKEETIQSSVSKILPILLDDDRQLFIAGNMGDEKALCKLMVINNKSTKEIMKASEESQQTIMHSICEKGGVKAVMFLQAILSPSEFMEYLFLSDHTDVMPIEYSLWFGQSATAQHLFSMPEVIAKYQNDENLLFRLTFFLFVRCGVYHIIDFVLDKLDDAASKVGRALSYKSYPAPTRRFDRDHATDFHRIAIMHRIAYDVNGKVSSLKKLKEIVGAKAFVDGVFVEDYWDENALQNVIETKKVDMMQYMLTIPELREVCLKHDELYTIVSSLNRHYHEEMVKAVVKGLNLTEKKLSTLKQTYANVQLASILKHVQKD